MFREKIERILLRIMGEMTLGGQVTLKALLKRGLKIGDNCNIGPGVIIDPPHCWHIEIGNNVTLAPNVHILAHDASTKKHLGYTRIGKVKIGDNVFIGAGTIVLPHVTIGSNTIIGAASLVDRDIPDNVVAVGNPARIVCALESFLKKHREQMEHSPCFDEKYTLKKGVTPELKNEMNQRMVDGLGYIV
jgi:maltose O-acetyltransferase